MNGRYQAPEFLARFKCLGADCEDTCCKGWNMQLDPATHALYAAQAPALLASVAGDGDHAVMRRDFKTDYCVKFDGGLCGIQREHGERFLGDACYLYPRAARRLGGETTMTGTLSCPEIARLSLFDENGFADSSINVERLPETRNDYLPDGLDTGQAQAIHRHFIAAALNPDISPEYGYMRIFAAAESLNRVTPASWPDAVPFYLEYADNALLPAEPSVTDPAYLLQALCGLVAAAKYVHHARLMQTIGEMEQALHITIRWDTLGIASLPDSAHAAAALDLRWRDEWQPRYAPLLKRYLAMQLSLALFPFAGFGHTLPERAAVIGVRMATVKLALMSLCQLTRGAPRENDIVRVVQSLSRFLDHLAEPDFSLKIYNETGWLKATRLRGLLGDR